MTGRTSVGRLTLKLPCPNPIRSVGVTANANTVADGGKPGVIIFTDSTYAIAIAKADKMKAEIEALGGKVLEYVDTPIAETSQRMPQLTTTLLQKYGDQWTHSLAINDIYFDFMGPSLAAVGIKGDGAPKAVALVELKALVTGKWRRSRLKTGTACTRYMPNSDDIRIDALFFVPRRWPEQLANVWQG